jgi:hypothetical protein
LKQHSKEKKLICDAPKTKLCGAWIVRHRILATKIRILWRTFPCATENLISVAQKKEKVLFLWRTSGDAPQILKKNSKKWRPDLDLDLGCRIFYFFMKFRWKVAGGGWLGELGGWVSGLSLLLT